MQANMTLLEATGKNGHTVVFTELGEKSPSGEIPAETLSEEACRALAMDVLRLCDGLPVATAEAVLSQAQHFLKCTTRLDCAGPDFARALQLFGRARAQ